MPESLMKNITSKASYTSNWKTKTVNLHWLYIGRKKSLIYVFSNVHTVRKG